jgi:hypothetical protein
MKKPNSEAIIKAADYRHQISNLIIISYDWVFENDTYHMEELVGYP